MASSILDPRMETLLRVMETGSFSKAAKSLYVSSVSVKKQMDSLEGELRVKLFNRTNRGITPTPAGRLFADDVARIAREAEEAVARVRREAESARATVRVGTSVMRPCRALIDLWTRIGGAELPFRVEIVPFEDRAEGLAQTVASLGETIDCFVGPCDSVMWRETCSVLLLDEIPCRVALPATHRLAARARLTWDDLDGETLMLVRAGESPVLDRLRAEIGRDHPGVTVEDVPHFYDLGSFNACVQRGCAMESLDIWAELHPGLVTLPMSWDYVMPYGIVYAAEPSPAMAAFVEAISERSA